MQQADSSGEVLLKACLEDGVLSQESGFCLHAGSVPTSTPCSSPAKAEGDKTSPPKRDVHPQVPEKLRPRILKAPCSRITSKKNILACAGKGLHHHSLFVKRPEQFGDHRRCRRDTSHPPPCLPALGERSASSQVRGMWDQCSQPPASPNPSRSTATPAGDALLCMDTSCLRAMHHRSAANSGLTGSTWEVSFKHPEKPQTQPHLGEKKPQALPPAPRRESNRLTNS